MIHYDVYTDGACKGNPGPGGYAFVLLRNGVVVTKESCGYRSTTNNRMELRAVIHALENLTEGVSVVIHSDSKYIVNAINEGWLRAWCKNKWRTSSNKPVKNIDLWKRFLLSTKGKKVSFLWVHGHNGNKYNELCDSLAVAASQSENLIEDEIQEI